MNLIKYTSLYFFVVLLLFLVANPIQAREAFAVDTPDRLELLKDYADRVLETGRDQWSGQNTPLFTDGVNVDTGDPVIWIHQSGRQYQISNMASQQNLFRFFTGLSNLTGDDRYKDAAKEAIRYMFDNFSTDSGLLRWGGHQFVDIGALQVANDFDSNSHEFKNHFPFYELMWEVDEEATTRFLQAFWNAHITDWSVLDMNRHGSWSAALPENLWDNEFGDPEPFFEGDGLTFINAGSDLIFAGGMLYQLNGEQGALDWAHRLHDMYVAARHPDTGLGVYQYSKPERKRELPDNDDPIPTSSSYGDRAENQFGPEYGELAREGWVMWGGRIKSIYVNNGFMQLGLAESMGEAGSEFLESTAAGLRALVEQSYNPQENHFPPMWADGTDLTGQTMPRYGYYCRYDRGCDLSTAWQPLRADMEFFMTYARAFRLTGEELFWETARNMAQGLGLGEVGQQPGVGVALNMDAEGSNYQEIFALLELYRAAPHPEYLERAQIVADNIIDSKYHNGYFLPSGDHVHANFNTLEPLALLTLEAVLQGEEESVPAHMISRGYIHGTFGNQGRTYDTNVIWPMTREDLYDFVPAKVETVYPKFNMTVPTQPVFEWKAVSFAKGYRFQITSSNFSEILKDTYVYSTSFEYPEELEPGQSHRWRVRAWNNKLGPWSDDIMFHTHGPTSAETDQGIPSHFLLDHNYPNPFNPVTAIQYGLPVRAQVTLRVYDLLGREVAVLVNGEQQAGYHNVVFDAGALSSGMFHYRMEAVPVAGSDQEKFIQTRSMTLIK